MDIDLLVISVGNTRAAVGLFRAAELTQTRRVPTGDEPAFRAAVAELWSQIGKTEDPGVVAASVRKSANDMVERVVREVCDARTEWVGLDVELPIDVLTDAPEKTGVDRVLNVAAAYEQMGKACVVVDAGTAVTVNLCDDQGNFLGGAIAPGVQAQLASLRSAANLPTPTFAAPEGPFGKSTEQAILQGIYHGIRGMVKELLEAYATHLGNWPELIVTGGDADALFKDWELVHAASPDLALYGLALAYANHHIEHGT